MQHIKQGLLTNTQELFLLIVYFKESSRISDDIVEAQPLWEYPGIALTEEQEIANISMLYPPENILENHGVFNLKG